MQIKNASLVDGLIDGFTDGLFDVSWENGVITSVEPSNPDKPAFNRSDFLDAEGAALIPGLHDHHIHLLALLESFTSLQLGPDKISGEAEFAQALKRAAYPKTAIRGIGYHETTAGELDKHILDDIVSDKPVRIQHRSGALWVLNTKALEELGIHSEDGRLFRMDSQLVSDPFSESAPGPFFEPDLRLVSEELIQYGVTGVTDATPGYTTQDTAIFKKAVLDGSFVCDLTLMADEYAPEDAAWIGPKKIILDDFNLADFTDFCEEVAAVHSQGRNIAIHSVTRAGLAFSVAMFLEVGALDGDRIEHASVAPPELVGTLSELGVRVVTQPNFISERGDEYIESVDKADLEWLYRCRGWLDAGVRLAAGTDAPFGSHNPWDAVWAAMNRETRSGQVLGSSECLSFVEALKLFLSSADNPGGQSRIIKVGAKANLCLLSNTLEGIAAAQPKNPVELTFINGNTPSHRKTSP